MAVFKALWVTEAPHGVYETQVVERDTGDLPAGDVLIRVQYSSLNYKDALSASGNRGVTRKYPHTPGIDAAGVVAESSVAEFAAGDEVIVTGYDLGMNTAGGFGQYIRVPAAWVIKRPQGLSLREAMILGTAGLTAALCVEKLERSGLRPDHGSVLVTGASGGVGSIAVELLAKLGYTVAAATGKLEQAEFLNRLGAKQILDRATVADGVDKPLLKEQWAGAVDTVGGDILFNVVKSLQYGGSVACCGLTAGAGFKASVLPFILRGVNLLGVDSVELPLVVKASMWDKLSLQWKLDNLEEVAREIARHDGRAYGGEGAADGLAIREGVLRMQAPASPLFDHPARQVADHAQAAPGKIAEQRRQQGRDEVPEQPDLVAQPRAVFLPVATAAGDAEDPIDTLAPFDEGQDLAAQAMADPVQGLAPALGERGGEHGAAVMTGPAQHIDLETAQRAVARLPHAQVVEGDGQVAALCQPGGEGRVEALFHSHRRDDQEIAARLPGRPVPMADQRMAVAVIDEAWLRRVHAGLRGLLMASRIELAARAPPAGRKHGRDALAVRPG